jgi:hypothetical protein
MIQVIPKYHLILKIYRDIYRKKLLGSKMFRRVFVWVIVKNLDNIIYNKRWIVISK